jgi:alpha-beta hydrolase superfamily lysophospholipase
MVRWIVLLTLVSSALLAVAWWSTRPPQPDAFYAPPAAPPVAPGRLLRQEPFTANVPAGAQAWRILYTTTRTDGTPAVASAIVMMNGNAPDRAAGSRRPAILWTHGTTGVQPGCAPALIDAPFANVPGLQALLERGWVYVATDYAGQGTAGPHPYLIGAGQARSALDALRAAGRIKELQLANAAVVWGHSQGGHAALWTGILAPSYAPELGVLGVAAVAPASDLGALIEEVQHTVIGRVMTSYLLQAYSAHYDDVRFDDYARGVDGALAHAIATRCLAGRGALGAVGAALFAGGSIFDVPPTTGALGKRLEENTPWAPPPVPVLLGQGLADDLVLPQVQKRFVRNLCARGATLRFVEYAGRDHLSVVAPDSPFISDLVTWTAARFEGEPPTPGCQAAAR